MSHQKHDNGYKKAHREGAPTRGRAAAERRKAAKRARAAVLLARVEAATLAGERAEEFFIRERARIAGVLVEPQPEPTPAPPLGDACAHCGGALRPGSKRYCSVACRKAHQAASNTPGGAAR